MGGWKTILLLKIFLFFYVHIRVCFAAVSYTHLTLPTKA